MSGRIRSIKPELLEDAVTAGLSHEAFRLFIGLLLLADDPGNFRAEPEWLRGQVFWRQPAATPVAELLEELHPLVLFYEAKGQRYGAVRNWKKHQKISHPAPGRVPGPPPESLPSPSGAAPENLRSPSAPPASLPAEPPEPSPTHPPEPPEPLRPDLDQEKDLEKDWRGGAPGGAPEHDPRPSEVVRIRKLPTSEPNVMRAVWFAAYAEAVTGVTGKPFALDRRDLTVLADTVEAHCPDWGRSTEWIRETVDAFVAATRTVPQFHAKWAPRGLLAWLNTERQAERPSRPSGIHGPGGPAQPAPADGKYSWDVGPVVGGPLPEGWR